MFVISFNNNISGQLIKLYDCTWRGLIKRGEFRGHGDDSRSLFKPWAHYLDKCVELKPHRKPHTNIAPAQFYKYFLYRKTNIQSLISHTDTLTTAFSSRAL